MLGTGWARSVRWVDIEVAREPGGRPTLALHGATLEHARRIGVKHISLSITHTAGTAFAEVIFENLKFSLPDLCTVSSAACLLRSPSPPTCA